MSIDLREKPTLEESRDVGHRGLLASFSSAESVLHAVRKLRQQGYTQLDVHSPFPVHGLDDALQLKGSPLSPAAAIGAAVGLAAGLGMAWWMNAVDYAFIISGKPLFSVIPSLPVAFELAILLAAFAVFGGTLLLGNLTRLANPKFRVPGFARATNDRFLLAVDSKDGHFDDVETPDLLEESGADSIDEIPLVDPREERLPRFIWMAGAVIAVLALIPPAMIAKARSTTSSVPRLSFVSDMDHQPSFKAQTTSSLFADGRSMRPQVPGTIAVGDLREDHRYYLGRETDALTAPAPSGDSGKSANNADPEQTPVDWVTEFPVTVNEEFIRRGRERYDIYCSVCHGLGGDGDGLVTLRAMELEQGTWVRPTSLHAEPIREQPIGQIYNTISNGVRKMPGYSSQIPVSDRWAIAAYVRALQKTRTASVEDVPAEVVPSMRELN